jgi:hypothetical protein
MDKEDKTAKMGLEELRDQLRKSKREVTNRDTTLRALQRNYETLAAVHEEGKAEHQRRKIAFDQIRCSHFCCRLPASDVGAVNQWC